MLHTKIYQNEAFCNEKIGEASTKCVNGCGLALPESNAYMASIMHMVIPQARIIAVCREHDVQLSTIK